MIKNDYVIPDVYTSYTQGYISLCTLVGLNAKIESWSQLTCAIYLFSNYLGICNLDSTKFLIETVIFIYCWCIITIKYYYLDKYC